MLFRDNFFYEIDLPKTGSCDLRHESQVDHKNSSWLLPGKIAELLNGRGVVIQTGAGDGEREMMATTDSGLLLRLQPFAPRALPGSQRVDPVIRRV